MTSTHIVMESMSPNQYWTSVLDPFRRQLQTPLQTELQGGEEQHCEPENRRGFHVERLKVITKLLLKRFEIELIWTKYDYNASIVLIYIHPFFNTLTVFRYHRRLTWLISSHPRHMPTMPAEPIKEVRCQPTMPRVTKAKKIWVCEKWKKDSCLGSPAAGASHDNLLLS